VGFESQTCLAAFMLVLPLKINENKIENILKEVSEYICNHHKSCFWNKWFPTADQTAPSCSRVLEELQCAHNSSFVQPLYKPDVVHFNVS
jgi:hypothetical protein